MNVPAPIAAAAALWARARPEEESVNVVVLILAIATLWLSQAAGVARLMNRMGFHPLPWFAVTALLGPAMWPLAVVDLVSGLPGPVSLRRGSLGPGPSMSSSR
jgi:hypothetical protein